MKLLSKTFCILALALSSLLTIDAAFAQTSGDDNTFQGLGGKDGIKNIIDTFLPIILADERIKNSFKDADMDRLGFLLAEQFCDLSGGPCKYSGKNMKDTHASKEITNAHFNALAEDLQMAMDKQGVPSSVQNKLIAKLAPMQSNIVTK